MSQPHDAVPEFGYLLRRARHALGLTQEQLAEQAGLSVRGISDLERGARRSPQRATLELLADALQLSDEERSEWERSRRAAAQQGSRTATVADDNRVLLGRLTPPLSNLIGRNRELDELRRLVRAERLVTILGTGGVGKTSLAVAVAGELSSFFHDGTFSVDLVPISDVALVLPTIAATLGVTEAPGQPVDAALASYLAGKHALLVLDNLEQVIEAAAEIGKLLDRCPRLHVLATSRTPLRISGEREYPLGPLDLPDMAHLPPVEELAGYGAIRLFVERARAVLPSFELSPANAGPVAEICARLDGLPLAIELAASRSRLLTPGTMLDRFERWLPALSRGARDLPARHQTLRDAIRWSYDLLGEEQQRLFRALSIFHDGWTLDLAVEVVGADFFEVLDGLDALVSHSLVRVIEQPGAEPRFGLLETIREFGLEQLEANGEIEAVGAAHAHAIRRLIEEISPLFEGARQIEAMDCVEREHANIRAAFSWFIDRQETESASLLVRPLWLFWWMRGYISEGRSQYERVLALPAGSVPIAVQAELLTGLGIMIEWTADLDRAIELQHQAIALWEQVPDEDRSAAFWSHICLGNIAARRGDFEEAIRCYRMAVDLGERLNSDRARSSGWLSLGVVALMRGEIEEARENFETSLHFARRTGEPWGISLAANNLADVSLQVGDLELAERWLEEAEPLSIRLNHRWQLLWSEASKARLALYRKDAAEAVRRFQAVLQRAGDLGEMALLDTGIDAVCGLGEAYLLRSDLTAARRAFSQGVDLAERAASNAKLAPLLEGVAGLMIACDRIGEAARLLGAAQSLRESSGAAADAPMEALIEQRVATVRETLGETAYTEELQAIRTMALTDMLSFARDLLVK